MEDYYIEKIQQMENMCNTWVQKANEALMENGGKSCKEQVICLQKAAAIRGDMARCSYGAEKAYYNRMKDELNQSIRLAIAEFDPAFLERIKQSRAATAPGNTRGTTESTTSSSSAGNDSAVSAEDVKGWFKETPKHGFDAISGMADVVKKLKVCCRDTRLQKLQDFLEIEKQKSFILVGPPGCGKTFITEAFVHELATGNAELVDKPYKFMKVDGSDILSRYVGDAEKIVARVFEEAEKNAPCVLFFDEIDGVCKDRSKKDLPAYAETLTTSFLVGYNRIKASKDPVIVIGATNYPRNVDKAMMDRVEMVKIGFPDMAARAKKFELAMPKNLAREEKLTFERMGELTETATPYNYRDIERLCQTIKETVMEEVLAANNDSQEKALEMLQSGAYKLTEACFVCCQEKTEVSRKDESVAEIDSFFEEKQGTNDSSAN